MGLRVNNRKIVKEKHWFQILETLRDVAVHVDVKLFVRPDSAVARRLFKVNQVMQHDLIKFLLRYHSATSGKREAIFGKAVRVNLGECLHIRL